MTFTTHLVVALTTSTLAGCLDDTYCKGSAIPQDTMSEDANSIQDTGFQDTIVDVQETTVLDTEMNDKNTDVSCPTLEPGDLFTIEHTAYGDYTIQLFLLNANGERMYFPNKSVYYTWYSDFTDVVKIANTCVEAYPARSSAPFGINYRPGSRLIRVPISETLWVILPGNTRAKISPEAAKELYGNAWQNKVVNIGDPIWPNYVNIDKEITSPTLQDGMMVRVFNSDTIWYIKEGKLWEVMGDISFWGEDIRLVSDELVDALEVADNHVTINDILDDPSQLTAGSN